MRYEVYFILKKESPESIKVSFIKIGTLECQDEILPGDLMFLENAQLSSISTYFPNAIISPHVKVERVSVATDPDSSNTVSVMQVM